MAGALTPPRRFRWKLRAAIYPLLLGPALWGFWWEPASLAVREHALAPVDPRQPWPAPLAGLRIAQLSDLHVGAPWMGVDKLRAVVDRTNAAAPELVVLTGDYVEGVVGGRFVSPAVIARELARLRAPLGVYVVLGNHDWRYSGIAVQAAFAAAGVRTLDGAVVPLQRQGRRFWLLGISDWTENLPDWRGPLATVPDGEPVIAFTHNPDLFPQLPARFALVLAGHTHGGQVRLPWLGTPAVPSTFGSRYVRGRIVEDGRMLFVSTGIGTSGLPVRFGVPPEISVVTLAPAAAAP